MFCVNNLTGEWQYFASLSSYLSLTHADNVSQNQLTVLKGDNAAPLIQAEISTRLYKCLFSPQSEFKILVIFKAAGAITVTTLYLLNNRINLVVVSVFTH